MRLFNLGLLIVVISLVSTPLWGAVPFDINSGFTAHGTNATIVFNATPPDYAYTGSTQSAAVTVTLTIVVDTHGAGSQNITVSFDCPTGGSASPVTFTCSDGTLNYSQGRSVTLPAGPGPQTYTAKIGTTTYGSDTAYIKYTVTASVSGSNGSVAPALQYVASGDNATVTASPNANYTVGSWTGSGSVSPTDNRSYSITNITSNQTVSVSFCVNNKPV